MTRFILCIHNAIAYSIYGKSEMGLFYLMRGLFMQKPVNNFTPFLFFCLVKHVRLNISIFEIINNNNIFDAYNFMPSDNAAAATAVFAIVG